MQAITSTSKQHWTRGAEGGSPAYVDRPAEFIHAMGAACALLAVADGYVMPSERDKYIACVQKQPILQEFKRDEIVGIFEHYERELTHNLANGLRGAFAMIRPLAKRPHDAKALVEACWAVLSADGFARKAEFQALDAIRRALGLLPPEATPASELNHKRVLHPQAAPAGAEMDNASLAPLVQPQSISHLAVAVA